MRTLLFHPTHARGNRLTSATQVGTGHAGSAVLYRLVEWWEESFFLEELIVDYFGR